MDGFCLQTGKSFLQSCEKKSLPNESDAGLRNNLDGQIGLDFVAKDSAGSLTGFFGRGCEQESFSLFSSAWPFVTAPLLK